MSDQVDVAAIREALAKATSGPWCVVDDQDWEEVKVIKGSVNRRSTPNVCTPICTTDQDGTQDADLIVLLRNNAEALLDALERAQAASEGVDMLVAQAERRGAVKALRGFGYRDVTEKADAIENGADL